ncbi:MAG: glycosyltransferase family 4 protein [Halosimplex sp.]
MATVDLLVVGPANRTTGGIARFLSEQRRRLSDDVDVRVYDGGTTDGELAGGMVLTALITAWAILRFPFRRRPDVVHVHTSDGLAFYRASWYVLVAGLLWRRPVVVHVHGSSFDDFVRTDSPVSAGVQDLTFGVADRVVSLSDHWRSVLSDRVPASKLVVVPNAVDPGEYDPSYDADPPVVVFVSNHIERKGIREFTAAVERATDADIRVRIAGSGPLADLSADLAADSPTVEYLGYVSEAEKRRVIETATAYVLPTYAEGLPIALLEGMAGGNAVITTDVDAIPEVVDDGSGWVVEPGDVDALTDALRAVAEDPDAAAAMGRHNRAIIEERFAWPTVVDRLTDVYRSLASTA